MTEQGPERFLHLKPYVDYRQPPKRRPWWAFWRCHDR